MKYDNLLPNVFFLSSGKSGTGSLYKYLKHCPSFSIHKQKELNFFAFSGFPQMEMFSDSVTTLDNYVTSISDTINDGRLRFDISPVNFYFHEKFCVNVNETYGEKINELKYVFFLRDPVSRSLSHFNMNFDVWDFRSIEIAINDINYSQMSFNEKISKSEYGGYNYFYDYIGASLYSDRISYIIENLKIDPDRYCIVNFDDFISDTAGVLKYISSFLEINDDWIKDLPIYKTGSNGSLRFGWLYRFLVKPNFLKDVLKWIPLFRTNTFKKFKAWLYSSKMFKGNQITIDSKLRAELLERYFYSDIESLENNYGLDLSRWKSPRQQ